MSEWAAIETAARVRDPGSVAPPVTSTLGALPPARGGVVPRAAAGRPRSKRQQRVVLGSIDAGAHLLQRHARTVILGSCVFTVPMVALFIGLQWWLVVGVDDFDTWVEAPLGIGRPDARGGIEVLVRWLVLVLASLTSTLVTAYCTAVTLQTHVGAPVAMRRALATVLRRLPLVVGTWLLSHPMWFFFAWLATLPSLLQLAAAFVVVIPVALLVCTPTWLMTPVAVAEPQHVGRSVRRGFRAMRLSSGAVMGVILLLWLVCALLILGLALLPWFADATGLIPLFGQTGTVAGVLVALALILVMPLIGMSSAQLYLQLRMHHEGMDLVESAAREFGR